MSRLREKTAIVTGASRGIGLGIARAFAAEGARVLLTDVRDDDGQAAADELGAAAEYRRLDVRDEVAWDQVVEDFVASHGRLNVLVNNAGVTGFEDDPGREQPVSYDPEHGRLADWRAVHETNLDGVFLGCRAALRAMRPARKGSIINVSSRAGVVGVPRACAYASSKAAVRNHTKSVALYCAEEGLAIRCNSIQPAAILTPLWDPMLGRGLHRGLGARRYATAAPLNRFGTAAEVAALAVYLAADESAFTTGAEFNIDGGMLAGASDPPTSGS